MNFPFRISSHTWIVALLAACGFLLWIDAAHVQRVEYISALAEPAVTVDAGSKTGYAAGLRQLIVPEHNNESYQWIAQTQQMLAQGEMRLRHVDYDNAPLGREVRTTSPYRWWLALVAWCEHVVSGRPLALSVERAALFADPILQFLLLGSAVFLTARQLGNLPATLLAIGAAMSFPFTSIFLPGQPTDHSLSQLCAIWSVLPLLAAIHQAKKFAQGKKGTLEGNPPIQRWGIVGGIAGGIGLWVSISHELPILAGIIVSGLIAARLTPPSAAKKSGACLVPWRIWGLAGGLPPL